MFMFKAKEILKEINKFSPEILISCKKAISKSKSDLDFHRLDKAAFKKCDDIAVMEKTSRGVVIPLDAGWTDIGSWESVWETSNKDLDGNYKEGKVLLENTKNSYIRSENRLRVGIDLNDLVIVDTKDAILVSNKKSSQKVKI